MRTVYTVRELPGKIKSASKMERLVVICTLAFCSPGILLAADLSDPHTQALESIADFADRICDPESPIPLEGSGNNLRLSIEAKANLNKLLKSIADIGIEGSGIWENSEWQGVLQEDLARLLISKRECKEKIAARLIDKLMPDDTPSGKPSIWKSKRGNWNFKDTTFFVVGEKGFNKAYLSERNYSNFIYEVRLRKVSGNDGPIGLLIRYDEANDEGYMLLVWPLQGKFQFSRVVSDERHRIGGGSPTYFKTGTNWNTIRVTAEGSNFDISFNGRDTISFFDDYYHFGKAGLVIHGVSKNRAEFDVLKLEPQ